MKKCNVCQVEKTLDEFWKRSAAKDGRQAECIGCGKRRNAEYKSVHGERVRAHQRAFTSTEEYKSKRNAYLAQPEVKARYRRIRQDYERNSPGGAYGHSLWKRYRLSWEDYEALLDKQDGRCPVCRRPLNLANKRLTHVDHDHLTGRVRGVLCARCNIGIAFLDTGLHSAALAYLSAGHIP